MDTITHGLTGLLIGECAGAENRKERIFWAVAAMAPDLDLLTGLAGRVAYFTYHRRLLHGVAGACLLILAGTILYRRSGLGTTRKGLLVSLAAVASHIFLDLSTAFGTTVFWPFLRKDYYLDLLFIVDIAFTSILLVSLVLCYRAPDRGRKFAFAGLLALCLYISAAFAVRTSIRSELENFRPGSRVTLIPQPPTIFNWAAFIETGRGTWVGPVSFFERNPAQALVFHSGPGASAYLEKAKATLAGRRFLRFARWPEIKVETSADGVTTFLFTDLRFTVSGRELSNYYFGMKVIIDKNGDVLYQGLTNR